MRAENANVAAVETSRRAAIARRRVLNVCILNLAWAKLRTWICEYLVSVNCLHMLCDAGVKLSSGYPNKMMC